MDDIRSSEYLLLMTMMVHLIMAPFTKVEESFNTQALHDILFHDTHLSEYDHLEFPGVVPRTFAGPLALASVLYPLKPLSHWLQWEKYWMLFIGRFCLGFAVVFALGNFCRCVEKHFHSRLTGTLLRLIVASQFHFLFYASRTLPNTFALVLVLVSYQKLLDRRYSQATVLATMATCLFRFELVLLYGPIYMILFAMRKVSVLKTIGIGIGTLVLTLAVTVPMDSYFWRQWPMWPEGRVIRFNVWENRSGEYGVTPYWWYFKSALPRALTASAVFIPLGFAPRGKRFLLLAIVLSAIAFILLYSFLPHKELRFIIYALPLLNLPAARFMSAVWAAGERSWMRRLIAYGVASHLLMNLMCSGVFLYASSRNYPGGDALSHLQYMHRYMRNKPIAVHIDVYSAQNGVNRFLHLYDSKWEYNKSENLEPEALARFDYLLVGSSSPRELAQLVGRNYSTSHREHFAVDGFHRMEFKRWGSLGGDGWKWRLPLYYPTLEFKRKVVVMKKRD